MQIASNTSSSGRIACSAIHFLSISAASPRSPNVHAPLSSTSGIRLRESRIHSTLLCAPSPRTASSRVAMRSTASTSCTSGDISRDSASLVTILIGSLPWRSLLFSSTAANTLAASSLRRTSTATSRCPMPCPSMTRSSCSTTYCSAEWAFRSSLVAASANHRNST